MWIDNRGRIHACNGGYPCKHVSMSSELGKIKRKMISAERFKVRKALRKGFEPPVDQHKHRALWDLV